MTIRSWTPIFGSHPLCQPCIAGIPPRAMRLAAFAPCGLCSAQLHPCFAAASVASPSRMLTISSLASLANTRGGLWKPPTEAAAFYV